MGFARGEETDDEHGDGEEGNDAVECLAVEEDGAVDVLCVVIEGEEALNDGCYEHD